MAQKFNLDPGQIDKQVFDDDKQALRVLAGTQLVSEAYDYIGIAYNASPPGLGEIGVVTFKSGGAGGATVAVLQLGYDGSNRLSSVTRI